MSDELRWDAPGPGTWELAADHYPRPITACLQEFGVIWSEESTRWMREVGLPIERATMANVNGFAYVSMGEDGGGPTPPAWLMPVLVKLVPSLRRAERRLRSVFRERPWREGLANWYGRDRDRAIARMLTLGTIDVSELDDAALAAHLDACFAELVQSAREHLAMHAHDTFPAGLFVLDCIEWGIDQSDALDLLTGSSPASRAASAELDALRSAVAGRTAEDLASLRALGPEVGNALDRYLERFGDRIIDGYDIDSATIREHPALIVRLATAPLTQVPSDDARVAAARASVAAPGRAEFDERLEEARLAYGVRDDNSGILIGWPAGLVRRAFLEAGRRLVARGELASVELAIEATVDELTSALVGRSRVDGGELERRAVHRQTYRAADAPRVLGDPPAAFPAMPGTLGKVFRMFEMFEMSADDTGGASTESHVHGTGIGATSYTGVARLVPGGSVGIVDFEPGDVLVAPMTSPSYNVLLAMAGALVTEAGGLMSHAAIMARELGLPAVLGAPRALDLIRDGDRVTVDPATGSVTVVERAPKVSAGV